MKKFTSEMVDMYANKLLIGLTEEENKMVLDEFEIIDKSIDIINNIPNLESVMPMSYCLDDFYVDLREDIVEESVPKKELLQNCGDTEGDRVKIVKVVG